MNAAKLTFTAALGFICCSFGSLAQTDASLPPHPRLLLNEEGVQQLKQRVAAASWAKASWEQLKANTEKALLSPVELPPRGGNWSHNYVCPTHGARLSQGRKIGPWQWEHICPVGDHVLRGDVSKATLDFDGNAIAAIHGAYAEQAVNDGLVYQVTGDKRFAVRAREILLAYAERYLKYGLHDNQGKSGQGGRVASQSLTEASWLIDMAEGADLVWDTFSQNERELLAAKLFRPALDQVILPRRLGIHNIQCRHNSAIGLVGYLLGDEKLIKIAIDDPAMGYRQQLAKGVHDDGMWLEGSSGYHFYTMSGLWPLAEAARNCGLELYNEKYRAMFDGPLNLAMPNLTLPNFNDSGTVALRGQSDLYELAFARYHNNAYLPLLKDSERRGRLALLFGVVDLPPCGPSATTGCRNSPASGYAILQQGTNTDATWLCLKYGPHGGGHGHPDKNSFVLYSRGKIVGTDAGTHAYGSPLHRDWDKTTLAHNTLVIDETSQAPATGKCIAFGTEHGVDYAITDAGPIYKGVKYTRSVAMLTPEVIVFVDQVESDAPHALDLAYHSIGTWEIADSSPVARSWMPPDATGYKHISRAQARLIDNGSLDLRMKLEDGWFSCLSIAAGEPIEIISGYGILKTTEDRVPILLQRRHAQSTAFVWAICLIGTPVKLRVSQAKDGSGNSLPLATAALVQANAGKRQWALLCNPARLPLVAPLPNGALLRTDAPFAVR
jgi:hypothetical protein